MNILITGVAGFIGNNICTSLLIPKSTNNIIGVDNLNSYYLRSLKTRRVEQLKTLPRFKFIQGSFFDTKVLHQIREIFMPDIIIHAAAEVGVRNGEAHPDKYLQTNTEGTSLLLESLGMHASHIILLSSSSVYGSSKPPFNEQADLQPISAYGVSKKCMEEYARYFWSKTHVSTTIIRPFSIYGPDGRPDMLPMQILFAAARNKHITITDRHTIRDWTYIDDFISAVTRTIQKPSGLQYINIGRGKAISNESVLKTAKSILQRNGYDFRFSFASQEAIEMPATTANISLLISTYHVHMPTGFEAGFNKTAEFFFSHKKLYTRYI